VSGADNEGGMADPTATAGAQRPVETAERAVEAGERALGAGERGAGGRGTGEGRALDRVIDVPLRLTVQIGSARMLVRDVLQLGRGSVIPLDRKSGDPADILVNGKLIARGEVAIVDDRMAVRVTELVGADARDDER